MPRRLKRSTQVIRFIEELCRVPEGPHVGEPFKLLAFQKRFIREVYDNPKGTHHAYLSVARKNGKTALLAALLLVHIVGQEAQQNSQVISGARSRDQAALLWSLAAKMIELNPELQEITHIIPSQKKILGLPMNVEYKALSADGSKNMGLSPVLAILDEIGQVVGPTDYFTDSITSSQGAHENPLLIAISTQAPGDADMWSIWLDDAIRSGDPHTVAHIYAAEAECDLLARSQWRKANPALGKFLNLQYLEQQMVKASRLPSEEAKARNLHLNNRIALEQLWLAPAIWAENAGPPDLEVFRDKGAHLGLDLSMRNDLTAAVLAAQDDDELVHLLPFAFSPLGGIEDRSRRDRVPYDQWARDGVIYAPPGDVLNYDMICEYLRKQMDDLGIRIKSVQFDRWRITELQAAAERVGFARNAEWEKVGQGFVSISPRMETFEAMLLERKIRHGRHPVLNLGAASAVVQMDPAGNRKLAKNKSSQKIDAVVAAVMATFPLAHNEEAPLNIDTLIV